MLDPQQTRAYLDRIGIEGMPKPTLESLDELVLAHQMAVPFETVGLHRAQQAPDLSVEALFDKVVAKGRGGYCFELNKLFAELLASLGFAVRPALSRAVRGREGRMPINHRATIVAIDGCDWTADVGFGGPMPAGALQLADEKEQVVAGETFFTTRGEDGWWRIERITRAQADHYDDGAPARRQVELELLPAAVEDIDFEALNAFCSQPGTLFRDHEVVNLRTQGGYLGLKDDVLTIREGCEKAVIQLEGREAVDAALLERFGMAY